jgi:RNA polymerase sigma-70 factor (ECF subfamily)
MSPQLVPMPTPLPPDLAARVRGGSADALGELYASVGPALASLARRLTGSTEEAEDVLHDVFLGLPEALRYYDERGRLEQWLRRVTARVALTRLRAHQRRREVGVPPDLPTTSGEAGNDDRLTLEDAVDRLPDALRLVLVLKMVEGYSHTEIAGLLDITARASEQRLHRAVQLLRLRLASSLEG